MFVPPNFTRVLFIISLGTIVSPKEKLEAKLMHWKRQTNSSTVFLIVANCVHHSESKDPTAGNNENVDFEKNYKHLVLKMESSMKGAKDKNTLRLLSKITKIRLIDSLVTMS